MLNSSSTGGTSRSKRPAGHARTTSSAASSRTGSGSGMPHSTAVAGGGTAARPPPGVASSSSVPEVVLMVHFQQCFQSEVVHLVGQCRQLLEQTGNNEGDAGLALASALAADRKPFATVKSVLGRSISHAGGPRCEATVYPFTPAYLQYTTNANSSSSSSHAAEAPQLLSGEQHLSVHSALSNSQAQAHNQQQLACELISALCVMIMQSADVIKRRYALSLTSPLSSDGNTSTTVNGDGANNSSGGGGSAGDGKGTALDEKEIALAVKRNCALADLVCLRSLLVALINGERWWQYEYYPLMWSDGLREMQLVFALEDEARAMIENVVSSVLFGNVDSTVPSVIRVAQQNCAAELFAILSRLDAEQTPSDPCAAAVSPSSSLADSLTPTGKRGATHHHLQQQRELNFVDRSFAAATEALTTLAKVKSFAVMARYTQFLSAASIHSPLRHEAAILAANNLAVGGKGKSEVKKLFADYVVRIFAARCYDGISDPLLHQVCKNLYLNHSANWLHKKPKHAAIAAPLAAVLLVQTAPAFFANEFAGLFHQLLKLLVEGDKKARASFMGSLVHLFGFYLNHCSGLVRTLQTTVAGAPAGSPAGSGDARSPRAALSISSSKSFLASAGGAGQPAELVLLVPPLSGPKGAYPNAPAPTPGKPIRLCDPREALARLHEHQVKAGGGFPTPRSVHSSSRGGIGTGSSVTGVHRDVTDADCAGFLNAIRDYLLTTCRKNSYSLSSWSAKPTSYLADLLVLIARTKPVDGVAILVEAFPLESAQVFTETTVAALVALSALTELAYETVAECCPRGPGPTGCSCSCGSEEVGASVAQYQKPLLLPYWPFEQPTGSGSHALGENYPSVYSPFSSFRHQTLEDALLGAGCGGPGSISTFINLSNQNAGVAPGFLNGILSTSNLSPLSVAVDNKRLNTTVPLKRLDLVRVLESYKERFKRSLQLILQCAEKEALQPGHLKVGSSSSASSTTKEGAGAASGQNGGGGSSRSGASNSDSQQYMASLSEKDRCWQHILITATVVARKWCSTPTLNILPRMLHHRNAPEIADIVSRSVFPYYMLHLASLGRRPLALVKLMDYALTVTDEGETTAVVLSHLAHYLVLMTKQADAVAAVAVQSACKCTRGSGLPQSSGANPSKKTSRDTIEVIKTVFFSSHVLRSSAQLLYPSTVPSSPSTSSPAGHQYATPLSAVLADCIHQINSTPAPQSQAQGELLLEALPCLMDIIEAVGLHFLAHQTPAVRLWALVTLHQADRLSHVLTSVPTTSSSASGTSTRGRSGGGGSVTPEVKSPTKSDAVAGGRQHHQDPCSPSVILTSPTQATGTPASSSSSSPGVDPSKLSPHPGRAHRHQRSTVFSTDSQGSTITTATTASSTDTPSTVAAPAGPHRSITPTFSNVGGRAKGVPAVLPVPAAKASSTVQAPQALVPREVSIAGMVDLRGQLIVEEVNQTLERGAAVGSNWQDEKSSSIRRIGSCVYCSSSSSGGQHHQQQSPTSTSSTGPSLSSGGFSWVLAGQRPPMVNCCLTGVRYHTDPDIHRTIDSLRTPTWQQFCAAVVSCSIPHVLVLPLGKATLQHAPHLARILSTLSFHVCFPRGDFNLCTVQTALKQEAGSNEERVLWDAFKSKISWTYVFNCIRRGTVAPLLSLPAENSGNAQQQQPRHHYPRTSSFSVGGSTGNVLSPAPKTASTAGVQQFLLAGDEKYVQALTKRGQDVFSYIHHIMVRLPLIQDAGDLWHYLIEESTRLSTSSVALHMFPEYPATAHRLLGRGLEEGVKPLLKSMKEKRKILILTSAFLSLSQCIASELFGSSAGNMSGSAGSHPHPHHHQHTSSSGNMGTSGGTIKVTFVDTVDALISVVLLGTEMSTMSSLETALERLRSGSGVTSGILPALPQTKLLGSTGRFPPSAFENENRCGGGGGGPCSIGSSLGSVSLGGRDSIALAERLAKEMVVWTNAHTFENSLAVRMRLTLCQIFEVLADAGLECAGFLGNRLSFWVSYVCTVVTPYLNLFPLLDARNTPSSASMGGAASRSVSPLLLLETAFRCLASLVRVPLTSMFGFTQGRCDHASALFTLCDRVIEVVSNLSSNPPSEGDDAQQQPSSTGATGSSFEQALRSIDSGSAGLESSALGGPGGYSTTPGAAGSCSSLREISSSFLHNSAFPCESFRSIVVEMLIANPGFFFEPFVRKLSESFIGTVPATFYFEALLGAAIKAPNALPLLPAGTEKPLTSDMAVDPQVLQPAPQTPTKTRSTGNLRGLRGTNATSGPSSTAERRQQVFGLLLFHALCFIATVPRSCTSIIRSQVVAWLERTFQPKENYTPIPETKIHESVEELKYWASVIKRSALLKSLPGFFNWIAEHAFVNITRADLPPCARRGILAVASLFSCQYNMTSSLLSFLLYVSKHFQDQHRPQIVALWQHFNRNTTVNIKRFCQWMLFEARVADAQTILPLLCMASSSPLSSTAQGKGGIPSPLSHSNPLEELPSTTVNPNNRLLVLQCLFVASFSHLHTLRARQQQEAGTGSNEAAAQPKQKQQQQQPSQQENLGLGGGGETVASGVFCRSTNVSAPPTPRLGVSTSPHLSSLQDYQGGEEERLYEVMSEMVGLSATEIVSPSSCGPGSTERERGSSVFPETTFQGGDSRRSANAPPSGGGPARRTNSPGGVDELVDEMAHTTLILCHVIPILVPETCSLGGLEGNSSSGGEGDPQKPPECTCPCLPDNVLSLGTFVGADEKQQLQQEEGFGGGEQKKSQELLSFLTVVCQLFYKDAIMSRIAAMRRKNALDRGSLRQQRQEGESSGAGSGAFLRGKGTNQNGKKRQTSNKTNNRSDNENDTGGDDDDDDLPSDAELDEGLDEGIDLDDVLIDQMGRQATEQPIPKKKKNTLVPPAVPKLLVVSPAKPPHRYANAEEDDDDEEEDCVSGGGDGDSSRDDGEEYPIKSSGSPDQSENTVKIHEDTESLLTGMGDLPGPLELARIERLARQQIPSLLREVSVLLLHCTALLTASSLSFGHPSILPPTSSGTGSTGIGTGGYSGGGRSASVSPTTTTSPTPLNAKFRSTALEVMKDGDRTCPLFCVQAVLGLHRHFWVGFSCVDEIQSTEVRKALGHLSTLLHHGPLLALFGSANSDPSGSGGTSSGGSYSLPSCSSDGTLPYPYVLSTKALVEVFCASLPHPIRTSWVHETIRWNGSGYSNQTSMGCAVLGAMSMAVSQELLKVVGAGCVQEARALTPSYGLLGVQRSMLGLEVFLTPALRATTKSITSAMSAWDDLALMPRSRSGSTLMGYLARQNQAARIAGLHRSLHEVYLQAAANAVAALLVGCSVEAEIREDLLQLQGEGEAGIDALSYISVFTDNEICGYFWTAFALLLTTSSPLSGVQMLQSYYKTDAYRLFAPEGIRRAPPVFHPDYSGEIHGAELAAVGPERCALLLALCRIVLLEQDHQHADWARGHHDAVAETIPLLMAYAYESIYEVPFVAATVVVLAAASPTGASSQHFDFLQAFTSKDKGHHQQQQPCGSCRSSHLQLQEGQGSTADDVLSSNSKYFLDRLEVYFDVMTHQSTGWLTALARQLLIDSGLIDSTGSSSTTGTITGGFGSDYGWDSDPFAAGLEGTGMEPFPTTDSAEGSPARWAALPLVLLNTLSTLLLSGRCPVSKRLTIAAFLLQLLSIGRQSLAVCQCFLVYSEDICTGLRSLLHDDNKHRSSSGWSTSSNSSKVEDTSVTLLAALAALHNNFLPPPSAGTSRTDEAEKRAEERQWRRALDEAKQCSAVRFLSHILLNDHMATLVLNSVVSITQHVAETSTGATDMGVAAAPQPLPATMMRRVASHQETLFARQRGHAKSRSFSGTIPETLEETVEILDNTWAEVKGPHIPPSPLTFRRSTRMARGTLSGGSDSLLPTNRSPIEAGGATHRTSTPTSSLPSARGPGSVSRSFSNLKSGSGSSLARERQNRRPQRDPSDTPPSTARSEQSRKETTTANEATRIAVFAPFAYLYHEDNDTKERSFVHSHQVPCGAAMPLCEGSASTLDDLLLDEEEEGEGAYGGEENAADENTPVPLTRDDTMEGATTLPPPTDIPNQRQDYDVSLDQIRVSGFRDLASTASSFVLGLGGGGSPSARSGGEEHSLGASAMQQRLSFSAEQLYLLGGQSGEDFETSSTTSSSRSASSQSSSFGSSSSSFSSSDGSHEDKDKDQKKDGDQQRVGVGEPARGSHHQ